MTIEEIFNQHVAPYNPSEEIQKVILSKMPKKDKKTLLNGMGAKGDKLNFTPFISGPFPDIKTKEKVELICKYLLRASVANQSEKERLLSIATLYVKGNT